MGTTVSDNEWVGGAGAWSDTNLAEIQERLADGFDPGQRLFWLRSTPLHQAAQEGAVKVIELLLASGAEVDPADSYGATPLWEAVRHGQDDAVRLLLAAGADPWRPCIAGRSPAFRRSSPTSPTCSPTCPALPASARGSANCRRPSTT